MGEVYRATDRRLHRTVAIKILGANIADKTDGNFESDACDLLSLPETLSAP
jgi:hypothetical protein